MNLREIIRRYKDQQEADGGMIIRELHILQAEILEKAKKAWQDAQKGCTPCRGAAAAYMDMLGPQDPTEQLMEMKTSLSLKKF